MRRTNAAKIAVALVCLLLAILILYHMFASGSLFLILLAGLMAVGACVGLFLTGSAWYARRRALPSEEALDELDRDDPRARVAMLRKSFGKGLHQFSSFDKGIYDLPWYVVIGESGSGKTEAIRHSGLGFPPGLHDELRGIGGQGTLNWWFTNEAVLLDTVGEWMSAEEQTDSPGEWTELCALLASHRARSPVNGVVLALSAESLIGDSEAETKAKSARLSRKLAHAQRTFGVRFPIFVVVTKCDRLVGFREFFEHLSPEGRQQMLGWSNPARLDEAYDPGAIGEHLQGVFDGLKRRRLELLGQFRAGEAGPAFGPGRAEAVYAFPDVLERLVPKLRTYMEAVFLLGEWSTTPLFLRGIFFTSSLQQAATLDPDVSERFGLPDEVKVSGEEGDDEGEARPYFLHDMFATKVFSERGLVVSAGASEARRRMTRALPWAFGLVGVSLLILLTWFSSRSLRKEMGDERGYWDVAGDDAQWKPLYGRWAWRPVVVPVEGGGDFKYAGAETVEVEGRELTTADLLGEIADRVEKPMQLPWMFRFTSRLEGDISKRRLLAGRALFESSVLFPVVRGAIERMAAQSADDWRPEATEALGQLARLALAEHGKAPEEGDEGPLRLDALVRYLLLNAPDEYDGYASGHSSALNGVLRKLYTGPNAGSWPPESLMAFEGGLEKALARGGESFGTYWDNQMAAGTMSTYFAGVSSLAEAADAFLAAEEGLGKLVDGRAGKGLPRSLVDHNIVTGEWERHFVRLSAASEEMKRNEGLLSSGTLSKAYEATGAATLAGAEEAFKKLRGLTSRAGDAADRDGAPAALRLLSQLDRDLKAKLETLRKRAEADIVPTDTERLDATIFAALKERAFAKRVERAFEHRFDTYALAHKQLVRRVELGGAFGLARDLSVARAEAAECRASIGKRDQPAGAVPLAGEAVKASLFACDLAERGRIFVLLKGSLDSVRDASDGLEGLVRARAKVKGFATEQRPVVPMTGVRDRDFDLGYNRTAAAEFLAGREALTSVLAAEAGGTKALLEYDELRKEFGALKTAFDGYFLGYLKYWLDVVVGGLTVRPPEEGGFFDSLAKVQPWQANESIGNLVEIADKALEGFDAAADAVTGARVKAVRRGIEAGRGKIASELFLRKCRDVTSRWGAAKGDPEGVRKAVLSSTPADFLQQYTVAGGAAEADVLMRYWDNLTGRALEELANAFQAKAEGQLARLGAFRAFPLAGPEGKGLEASGLLEARRSFDRLRMDPAGLPDGAIGRGARTEVARLDAALGRLARCDLEPDLGRWLAAADKVLAGLPRAEPFECEVTLLSVDEQKALLEKGGRTYDAASAVPIWRSIAISQTGRAALTPAKTEQTEAAPLGKLVYPGREVKIDLHKFSGDPPDKSIRASGPWACLLLLHDHGAEPSSSDGRVWNLGLRVKDDVGRQRTLWLRLAFARGLPALADWPRSAVAGGLVGPEPEPVAPSQREREQAVQLLAAARASRQRGDLNDAGRKLAAAAAADPRNADVARELDEVKAAIAAKAAAAGRAERYRELMAEASGAERAGDLERAADAYRRAAAFAPEGSTDASAAAERLGQEIAKRAAPPKPPPGEEGAEEAERLATAAAAVADAGRYRDAWKLIEDARKRGRDSPRLKELARRVIGELAPKPSLRGPLGIELRLIRGGTFSMGRNDGEVDERPVRRVTVSSFYMGRFEVTEAQIEGYRRKMTDAAPQGVERGEEPVVSVSWNEADRFCQYLSGLGRGVYRLPTEAEWEFAARGAEGRRFPWGNQPVAPGNANVAGDADGHAGLAPVGSFPAGATPEGVLDMFGNAGEWCRDWYGPYSADDVSDPGGPARGEQRTARGSAYAFTARDWPVASTRGNAPPGEKLDTIGFRVVRELSQEEREFERRVGDE